MSCSVAAAYWRNTVRASLASGPYARRNRSVRIRSVDINMSNCFWARNEMLALESSRPSTSAVRGTDHGHGH